MNPYKDILSLLDSAGVKYESIEHEPVYTSEQAASIRGLTMNAGAKSLLVKAQGNFALVVLPGDMRVDSKKLKRGLGVSKTRFATPDEVKELMGCEVGACYPFGNIANLRVVADRRIEKNEYVSFNPGRHDISIKMRWEDMKNLIEPEMLDLASSAE